jgi:hypothetical protein
MKTKAAIFLSSFLVAAPVFAQSPYFQGYNPQTQQHDKYLGNLNNNRFDPNSVSNPFGQYGSRFSPDSINNPYGQYGSRFSPYSPNNPYSGSQAPQVRGR